MEFLRGRQRALHHASKGIWCSSRRWRRQLQASKAKSHPKVAPALKLSPALVSVPALTRFDADDLVALCAPAGCPLHLASFQIGSHALVLLGVLCHVISPRFPRRNTRPMPCALRLPKWRGYMAFRLAHYSLLCNSTDLLKQKSRHMSSGSSIPSPTEGNYIIHSPILRNRAETRPCACQ